SSAPERNLAPIHETTTIVRHAALHAKGEEDPVKVDEAQTLCRPPLPRPLLALSIDAVVTTSSLLPPFPLPLPAVVVTWPQLRTGEGPSRRKNNLARGVPFLGESRL